MGRRGILGLAAAGAATLLSGCGRPHAALRYRLTLEVRTPQGLKTGSSVLQNELYGKSIIPLPGDIGGEGNIGEAPVVDLGNSRFLFAVRTDPLYRRDLLRIVSKVLSYPELKLARQDDDTGDRMNKATKIKVFTALRRQDYPMLVTFADINDPPSIKEVSPDDLTTSFGAGYALERITFQAVDPNTPLTTGFRDRFPKIAEYHGLFRKRPTDAPRDQYLAGGLKPSSFSTDLKK